MENPPRDFEEFHDSREFFPKFSRAFPGIWSGFRKRGRRATVSLPIFSVFFRFFRFFVLFSVSIFFSPSLAVFLQVSIFSLFSVFVLFIFRKKKKTGRHRSRDPFWETPIWEPLQRSQKKTTAFSGFLRPRSLRVDMTGYVYVSVIAFLEFVRVATPSRPLPSPPFLEVACPLL